ncbi:carbon-nitrogen hydrolase family protein [soil metagenome]
MNNPDGSAASQLRVAAIQMNSRDDKPANIETALNLIDQAAAGGARLVALPEIWPYLGPEERNNEAAESIPGPITDLFAERAVKHGMFIHAGTIYEKREGEPKIFNTAVVVAPSGDIIARYSKIHMFDVVLDGVASYQESATVAPGDEIVTVDIDGVQVGLAVCYDLRFPELFRILTLKGAGLIILPAAFTMTTGKDHWEVLIRARAIENQVFMIAPAQVGADSSGKWCYGRSMIVDPWGVVIAVAPDIETTVHATLDFSVLHTVRRQIPSLANRMPGSYLWPKQLAEVR